jgi:hypothetical protein
MTAIDGEIIPPGSKLKVGAPTVINRGVGNGPVNKGRKLTLANRHTISPMQHQILNILIAAGQPIGEEIGHLPRTGDIVDALGWTRDKSSFASVSRSLKRLERAGRIVSYQPFIRTRGNGRHYAVKP